MPVLPPLPGFMTIGKKTPPIAGRQPLTDSRPWSIAARTSTDGAKRPAPTRCRRCNGSGRPATGSSGSASTSRPTTRWPPSPRLSACTSWPSRTRCTPTSDRRWTATASTCSSCSRRSSSRSTSRSTGQSGVVVSSGEIMVFLGRDFIITVRHGQHSELRGLRSSLEADPEQLELGPGGRAARHRRPHRRRVRHVVGEIEEDIDEMETAVFDPEQDVDIEQIYRLKREILRLRRAVAPLAGAAEGAVQHPESRWSRRRPRVLPRCRGPPVARRGADQHLRRDADHAGVRRAGRGGQPAEPGHAQDLGLGGDRPGADRDRRHLRDEFPPHAGAELAVRLPDGDPADHRGVFGCCTWRCAASAGCSAPWGTGTPTGCEPSSIRASRLRACSAVRGWQSTSYRRATTCEAEVKSRLPLATE